MNEKRIIYSLHRPLHKALISTKWVCMFVNEINKKNKKVVPSSFYIDFFFYMIKTLNTNYNQYNILEEIDGVPNADTLNEVISHLNNYSKGDKPKVLKRILSNRKNDIERKVYSTYKATSYYITLAKNKFQLIDKNYNLNKNGSMLASTRSSFFFLSKKAQEIVFERILFADLHMMIPLILSLKSEKQNKWNIPNIHMHFIEEVYGINHFRYAQKSAIPNYNNVRIHWLNDLEVLDKNFNIRKRYLNIILEDKTYEREYSEIVDEYDRFENEVVKPQNKQKKQFTRFENSYNDKIKKGLHDQNFVNLYDIKKDFQLSFQNFEKMLNDYYEQERKKRLILFSNTVNSIDKRKRYYVRNKPVIKIKIF